MGHINGNLLLPLQGHHLFKFLPAYRRHRLGQLRAPTLLNAPHVPGLQGHELPHQRMQLVALRSHTLQQLGPEQRGLGIAKGLALHQLLIVPPAALHQLPGDHRRCHQAEQHRQLLGRG